MNSRAFTRQRDANTDVNDEQALRILEKLRAAGPLGFKREAGRQGHVNVTGAAATDAGQAFLAKAESAALLGYLTANKFIQQNGTR